MKNILNSRPTDALVKRFKSSTELVDSRDLNNKMILDIGCGYGWFELNALTHTPSKIIGTEITEEDLRTARKYIKDKRVDFTVANAIDLGFKNNYFHTVVSWEVIEHIPKGTEEQMFSEVSRVLKNGGSFYLSTPYKHVISNMLDPAWWVIGHRHYSNKFFVALAQKQGFRVEKIEVKGRMWSLLAELNMYIAKWVFRREPFFYTFFTAKSTLEYSKANGYATIFCKFVKIGKNS